MMLLVLFAIAVILLIVDRWKPAKYVKLHQQLGNDWAYYPIIGNTLKLIGNNEDIMNVLIQASLQSYKRKFKAVTFWLANMLFVITADADDARCILKSALDKKYLHKVMRDYLGNGSVFAPVKIWRARRKILVPTFAPRYVSKFVSVFEKRAHVLSELLDTKVGKGNLPLMEYMFPSAMDSVCDTMLGEDIDVQMPSEQQLFQIIREVLDNIADRLCTPWLFFDVIYKRLPVYARQLRLVEIANNVIYDIIGKKRKIMELRDKYESSAGQAQRKNDHEYKTFVEIMIENSKDVDKDYANVEVREECIVISVGATDTLSTGISFALFLMSQHAEVQEKVYKEIQEVLGDSGKLLQEQDLLKLKYLKAVIQETLRLYPPVPVIIRRIKKDLHLPSGLILPAGCDVLISIWGIQRNPEDWGKDANLFNPDRFMSHHTPTLTPNAFMAFSHGPRNCIGQQYGMLSMTTTLVTLLRRYRFTPATNFKYDENVPLRLSFELMIKHVDNLLVQIEYRNKM